MSFSTSSNISQHNIDMLEEQCHKMQQQHKEKQQLLVYLEEAAEAYCVEYVAQKAREKVKKTEAYKREEEEEMVGVHSTTPEQDASRECYSFGEH